MYIIGVTGGVGSGKSRVLEYLELQYGAYVLRLDEVGHTLLEPGHSSYDRAVELLGTSIVRTDGSLDRAAIGERIFPNPALTEAFNRIMHPAIREETLRIMDRVASSGWKLLVMEAALLLEQRFDVYCHEVWYVYADERTRMRRLLTSRHYSEERIRGTMAQQLTEQEFRSRCSFTVDNSGDFADTQRIIDGRMNMILNEPACSGRGEDSPDT